MDQKDPYAAALAIARKQALARYPELLAVEQQLEQDLIDIDEKDDKGRPTQKAKTALRRLQNPNLVSTHRTKTSARLKVTEAKFQTEAAHAHAKALQAEILYRQAKLEVDQFNENIDAQNLAPVSRKSISKGEFGLSFIRPFFRHLDDNNVSRSAFQRAPSWLLSTCAMLIGWSHRDPKMELSINPLRGLWRAGIIEAGNPEITAEEARYINAVIWHGQDAERGEIARLFGQQAYPNDVVTVDLLMACSRIAEAAPNLTIPQKSLGAPAFKRVKSSETEVVLGLLGLSENLAPQVDEIISFLKHRAADLSVADMTHSVTAWRVRCALADAKPEAGLPEDWVPDFVNKVIDIAGDSRSAITSENAFFAIMYAALRHSETEAGFAEKERQRQSDIRWEAINKSLSAALESGRPFKINDDHLAITDEDDEFHLIAQMPLTRETYLGIYRDEDDEEAASGSPAESDDPSAEIASAQDDDRPAVPGVTRIHQCAEAPQTGAGASFEVLNTDRQRQELCDENNHDPAVVEHADPSAPTPQDPDYADYEEVDEVARANELKPSTALVVAVPTAVESGPEKNQKSLFDLDDEDVI